METNSAEPRIPDAVEINKLIQQYMAMRSNERRAEVDSFVNSSTKADQLIIEVYKGLIASSKV